MQSLFRFFKTKIQFLLSILWMIWLMYHSIIIHILKLPWKQAVRYMFRVLPPPWYPFWISCNIPNSQRNTYINCFVIRNIICPPVYKYIKCVFRTEARNSREGGGDAFKWDEMSADHFGPKRVPNRPHAVGG